MSLNQTPALLRPSPPREPWKIRKPHSETASVSRAWVSGEDEKLIRLRRQGWSWMAISKALSGKTQACCRLRYEKLLNQSFQWTEERKLSLSLEYARSREQVWSIVGEKLGIPWRAAEAMHWHLGEHRMRNSAIMASLNNQMIERTRKTHTQRTAADDPSPGKRPAQNSQGITLPPISAILPEFHQHGWMAGQSPKVPRFAYQERWQGQPQ